MENEKEDIIYEKPELIKIGMSSGCLSGGAAGGNCNGGGSAGGYCTGGGSPAY
jgi:hypothetical protein